MAQSYAERMVNPFDDPELVAAMTQHGVVHRPGMAQELLAELAPLLTADGIDLDDLDADFDVEDLNAAFARATERRNLEISTPVGAQRIQALAVLRTASIAQADGRTEDAAALLASIEPDGGEDLPAVSQVIGAGLGALDTWFSDPPLSRILTTVRIPQWHSKPSRRAATDMLALARKHRAFDSLHTLIVRHAGLAVFEGTVLVVTGALATIADREGSSVAEVSARLLTEQQVPIPAHTPRGSQSPAGAAFARSSSTSAFGSAPPFPTAADHGLLNRFGAWLESEPQIAAPTAEIELAIFTQLLTFAQGDGFDLGTAKDAFRFSVRFFNAEGPAGPGHSGTQVNAAFTMDDYLHFQLECAKDPASWEQAHDFIEELLDELMDEPDDPIGTPSSELIRIAREADQLDPALCLAALSRTPVISGVRALLDWIGARRRVTQTGAVRRDEIREVAALLGIDAQGVTKHPLPAFEADEARNAIVYASSMWEVRELAAWWGALQMLQIIRTNTSSVAPGALAGAWLAEESVPPEAAGQLAAATIAGILTADVDMEETGLFAGFDREVLALTIARLVAALSPEFEPLEQPDEDDFRIRILFARSSRMLEILERLQLIGIDAQGAPVIRPEFRGLMAKAIIFAFTQLESSESEA